MTAQENTAKVQAMYAAFGAADGAGVMAGMSPDITWTNQGPADVDYFRTWNGYEGVAGALTYIGTTFDLTTFEPRTFIADGDHVAVLLRVGGTVRANGRAFEQDGVHVWRFKDGLAVSFQDFQDTAQVAAALRGE